MKKLPREDCGTIYDRRDSLWLRAFYMLVAVLAIGVVVYWRVRG